MPQRAVQLGVVTECFDENAVGCVSEFFGFPSAAVFSGVDSPNGGGGVHDGAGRLPVLVGLINCEGGLDYAAPSVPKGGGLFGVTCLHDDRRLTDGLIPLRHCE